VDPIAPRQKIIDDGLDASQDIGTTTDQTVKLLLRPLQKSSQRCRVQILLHLLEKGLGVGQLIPEMVEVGRGVAPGAGQRPELGGRSDDDLGDADGRGGDLHYGRQVGNLSSSAERRVVFVSTRHRVAGQREKRKGRVKST